VPVHGRLLHTHHHRAARQAEHRRLAGRRVDARTDHQHGRETARHQARLLRQQLVAHQFIPLVAQGRQLQRVAQVGAQRLQLPGFGDVPVDLAGVDRIDRLTDLGVRSGEHAHDVGIVLTGVAQQFVAALAGHALVTDQNRDFGAVHRQHRPPLLHGTGGEHGRQWPHQAFEVLQRDRLVVDVQDLLGFHWNTS
jgi:hypothetical protein